MYTIYVLQIDDAESGLEQEVECFHLEEAFCHLEHLIKSELADPDCPRALELRVRLKTVTKRPIWTHNAIERALRQVVFPSRRAS